MVNTASNYREPQQTFDPAPPTNAPTILPKNGEVITQEDASLYRSIFDAQAHAYWQEADLMIAHLSDHRLLGHVLADRYLRRPSTLSELETWLATYHDLPEADEIYHLALKLTKGNKAKLVQPTGSNSISGRDYGFETGTGFRNQSTASVKLPPSLRRVANKIDSALRQGDPATAKSLLVDALQQDSMSQEALSSLQARIAASYFYNGYTTEARDLTESSAVKDNLQAQWINALSRYKLGDLSGAANAFKTLADHTNLSGGDHAAAAFWAYRSLKHSGDQENASQYLTQAANEPNSFYGLLASAMSGHSAASAWSWRVPEFNRQSIKVLANHPAGSRALALVQIGQSELAEEELRHINPQRNHSLQAAMLGLAENSHMAGLTLKLASLTVNDAGKPYDAALYPVPVWQPNGGYHVERALMYALMRHESQFDPMAVSSQGACGLMQLMPATAEKMSGASHVHSEDGQCPDEFFDPAVNLGLGQNYVRHLAEQPMIGNNLLLLLAAYNGGPGRLSQRTDLGKDADPLLFIESLPAQETHDYVQQVLMQYWTYRARLQQPLDSLTQLAHGQWPHYVLHDTKPTREVLLDQPVASFAVASNSSVH